jgi:hypothetical protein
VFNSRFEGATVKDLLIPSILLLSTLPGLADPIPARPIISSTTGGIRGKVTISSGMPISGATIAVSATDGRIWVGVSNSDGEFRIGLLPPGVYRLAVKKNGHTPYSQKDLRVKAGAWLVPNGNRFDPCGTGIEHPLRLQSEVASYEFIGGHATSFSSEELERIPIQ